MASLYIVIFTGWRALAGKYYLLCTEEFPPILRPRRIHLHVFITSFKRKNDVTSSNAMNDVIFQLQMTSAITHFPCAFNVVNYCLIYHIVLTLALQARRVRILVSKC